MTRLYFDTEFLEDGRTIELLSIGIVRPSDGAELYLENAEADLSRANDWVTENVLPHLQRGHVAVTRAEIAQAILDFVGDDTPEWWAYYADYDWVALCQLYGRMVDLPEGWPMFCRDIKQAAVAVGNPTLPDHDGTEHHALADARWNVHAHAYIESFVEVLCDERCGAKVWVPQALVSGAFVYCDGCRVKHDAHV